MIKYTLNYICYEYIGIYKLTLENIINSTCKGYSVCTDPAKITGLQVNGQEVNQTRVIDETEEVSVSCFFTNGNPLVSVRLMDDTGRAQSSTTHGQGPLILSLGQFRCQDVWPTIKCEAPQSEHNQSVVIFGKCKYIGDFQSISINQ